jgi:hypothetical protein
VSRRWVAVLTAAALAAAFAPAALAAGHGLIALEGWIMPEGSAQSFGPRIAWVDPRTGSVRWQRLSDEIYPLSPSPDGRLVAFQRDGDLFVARKIGSRRARLVARGVREAAWSPNGRRLAFIRQHEVYLTGLGPRGARRASTGAHATLGRLVWAADARRIAFFRKVASRGCATVGVGVLRLATGATKTVYRPGTGPGACEDASDVAWSPAQRLAVATVDRVLVSGTRTVELRPIELGTPDVVDVPKYVTWLPGARVLAYTWLDCSRPGPCHTSIRTVRADGSGVRRVALVPERFGISVMRWWP